MKSLFYFSGRAGDLPLALLKHETDELRKVNEKIERVTIPQIRWSAAVILGVPIRKLVVKHN